MPYLNEVETDSFIVEEVRRSPKGKGYLLIGQEITAFLWNNDIKLKHLLTALATWVDVGEGKMLEVRNLPDSPKFDVNVVMEKKKPLPCKWIQIDTGYVIADKATGVNSEEENPFL